jgi:hypothetical protein
MADDSGKITAFDKAHYDQLLGYLSDTDKDVNTPVGKSQARHHAEYNRPSG